MKLSRIQFKLSFLMWLAVAVSVLTAFCTGPSLVTFTMLLTAICGFMFFYFPRYRAHPVLVGAAVGIFVATFSVGVAVLQVVVEAPRVQGQLYDEDGPAAFFIISFILWFMASLLTGFFGMLVGVVVGMFLEFVHADAADARFLRKSAANLFHRFNRIESCGAAGWDEAGQHADEDGDRGDDQNVAE